MLSVEHYAQQIADNKQAPPVEWIK
jgi:hypothetical protein